MSRRCGECNRLNPADAQYCYFDGLVLGGGQAGAEGSINFATWAFPSPFVFPGGQKCQNFLQLGMACHQHPKEAAEVLQHGYLETFFGTLGRIDLAMAAKAAATMPDQDRALDELIGKLPGVVLNPAELEVEPQEKKLGMFQVGQDHSFEITLVNKGDRLLHGKATVDCPWLVLGDSATPEKVFQLYDKMTLPVHVRGKALRAYNKPQKAEIWLESNGGTATVTVYITVAVKPFPEGVLSGATSPRQLAEKAKASPKEAAVLLEQGAVARWYESNGWPYPVQGPTASGIAAVQQLFEVLGLVKAPQVELSEKSVSLRGKPGERLEYTLTVLTQEKRAVVAHGVSDQPWLKVGPSVFRGQTASLPLEIASVPSESGQPLQAQVRITANGGQRFDVPVTLAVGEGGASGSARPSTPYPSVPVKSSPTPAPAPEVMPTVTPLSPAPASAPAGTGLAEAESPAPAPFAPSTPLPAPSPAPLTSALQAPAPAMSGPESRRVKLMRFLPLGIVLAGLLVAMGRDLLLREPGEEPLPEIDYANPVLDVHFHDAPVRGDFVNTPSMRFGLGIPDPDKPGRFRTKLIYDDLGRTCNVVVRVNKSVEYLWGIEQGAWKVPIKEPLGKDRITGQQLIGARATWTRKNPDISITQIIEIVPGGLSEDGSKRLLDTCLIRYDITNNDSKTHEVGLRFLLDTFIGSNDAVPFTIAGANEMCDTMLELNLPSEVPDYISALERQDLNNPGTVAHISLKYGAGLEPPSRVTLGAWPASSLRREPGGQGAAMQNTRWTVPVLPMALAKSAENPNGDSAVTLYWDETPIPPKQTRVIGFAYGLGSVTGDRGEGQLGLTAGGQLVAEKEFTLTAYVKNPAPGTSITLELPRGLSLVSGREEETVPPLPPGSSSPYSPVTWRVKAARGGVFRPRVTLSTGATLEHRLVVEQAAEIFN